jgi:uncharacterized protein YjdB
MKKTNLLRKLIVSTLLVVLTLTSINLLSLNNHAEAATVYNTEISSPASGNIFVSVDGTFSTASEKAIVDRINQIRLEACKQGVINPDTGKKLTKADYKPVVWTTVLEDFARIRAAEASVNWAHTRPNNKSTFKNKTRIANGYHSSENLAMGYDLLASIEGYYAEKTNWIKKSGMYGHYTNMISPDNTLVGAAGFTQKGKSTFTAMEFGTLFSSKDTNSHKRTGLKGAATQIVEVNVKYLVNSITISGSKSVTATKSIKLTATANMKNATKTATITKGLTWKSSNTKVATVDANGNVKGIAKGTVTITAACGGKSATFKVTVNPATKVKSVKLNTTSTTLKVKKTYQLKATLNPTNATNKNVTWKSSNTKVATVDANGKVTAKAAGTATITVTTKDGSKTATCKITVKK